MRAFHLFDIHCKQLRANYFGGGAYMLLVPLTISHSVHYILFERMFFFRNITSKGHKCIRIPHGNRFIFLWTVKILRTGKRSFFFKKQKLVGEYIHREKPSDTLGRHVFEWFFSAALFVYSIASPIHFSYPPIFCFLYYIMHRLIYV